MNRHHRLTNDALLHILSLSTDATAVYTGEELLIEMANDAMLAFWGKDRSVIGKTLPDAVPELQGQPFIGLLHQVWRSGMSYDARDTPARLKVDGRLQTFYFDFNYRALKDDSGQVYSILHTAKDVSERVRSAQQLAKSLKQRKKIARSLADNEARALSVLDTMADGVIISDLRQQVIYANEAAQNLFGPRYKSAFWENLEKEGEPISTMSHPAFVASVDRKKVIDFIVSVKTDDEKVIFLSVNAAPLFNGKGSLIGSIATLNDITRRQKLNNQLEESEKRFQALIRQAPVAILVLRGQELIVDIANDAMLRLLNRDSAIVGQGITKILPELIDQPAMQNMYEVLRTGRSFYVEEIPVVLIRNGEAATYYFNISYTPLYEEGQITGVLEVATEVTSLVEAQKTAEYSQEILSQAISSANIGTWMIDLIGDRLSLSERSRAIYGLQASDDLSPTIWLEVVQPAYREALSQSLSMVCQSGDRFSLEFLIDPLDGAAARWLRASGRAVRNRNQQIVGISGTVLDISEQKEMEQRKDDFISIASHELKTPVTSLRASLQVLDRMKNNPKSDMIPKFIIQARKSMERVSQLIDDLLNVGRMQKGELPLNMTFFNITQLINACSNPFSLSGKHVINVLGETNVQVYADEHRIDQVLVNLINNAIKYAPKSVEINIDVQKENDRVKISVIDYGPGIPKNKLPHLFERYYRVEGSRNHTSGLGLGLYISHEIISRHGGEIGAESELGKGSVFWFTLPIKGN